MTDEKFVFISEGKEKKNIAHSARNRRTHAGKGGKVRFLSDYLSKKELQSMNSEVTAYKLNSMMTWKEFKAMPDDIKVAYITIIREKYNPYDKDIAEAMGVHRITMHNEMKRLGLCQGKSAAGLPRDKEGFKAFCGNCNPDPVEEPVEEADDEPVEFICDPQLHENEESHVQEETPAVPYSGSMSFTGAADAALKTVMNLLGNTEVNITIRWHSDSKEAVVV